MILDWARGVGQKRTKYCRLELVLLFVFSDLRAFLIARLSIRNVRISTDERAVAVTSRAWVLVV